MEINAQCQLFFIFDDSKSGKFVCLEINEVSYLFYKLKLPGLSQIDTTTLIS